MVSSNKSLTSHTVRPGSKAVQCVCPFMNGDDEGSGRVCQDSLEDERQGGTKTGQSSQKVPPGPQSLTTLQHLLTWSPVDATYPTPSSPSSCQGHCALNIHLAVGKMRA